MTSPWRHPEAELELSANAIVGDEQIDLAASIVKGLVFGVPLSGLLWCGIIWVIRAW
ncbi:hypothetical protein [Sphingobium sp. B2]|uniref:hypothetical protein n=1 Tax=Sphingobium sp. B2 TaxID=2583228 RepID=UPI001643AF37|nr:hypothetical protein [Sphingobium sp. B2]